MSVEIFVSILLLGVPTFTGNQYEQEYYQDYEDYEHEGILTEANKVNGSYRMKRFPGKSSLKTLRPEEIQEVRGAINQILSGFNVENILTPHTKARDIKTERKGNIPHRTPDNKHFSEVITKSYMDILTPNSLNQVDRYESRKLTIMLSTKPISATTPSITIDARITESDDASVLTTSSTPTFTSTLNTEIQTYPFEEDMRRFVESTKSESHSVITHDGTSIAFEDMGYSNNKDMGYDIGTKYYNNSSNCETCNLSTSTCPSTPEYSPVINLPILMKIIANLTSEFETNLTQRLNETLHNMGLPTCGTPTEEPPTTSQYDADYTGSIVGKCYVCGLDVEGVPRHAHCADAFAGDFLPLVPIDPTARSKLSRYKKYCTYANNPGYAFNETRPRSIFGRFTGGCGVRWTDLSGIYTQRTCRNRLNPMMGKHFASKRMAKLEKSLWQIENGCIISPMATLIPLSRGISLYARFHACVCTGNWCNMSISNTPWCVPLYVVFVLAVIF